MAQGSDSLGNPSITGKTVDEVRRSTQFWIQQAFNQLNTITGAGGTPKFLSAVDANGNTISNLGNGVNPGDAVRRAQTLVLDTLVGVASVQQYNAQGFGIANLLEGREATDAVNVGQLKDAIATTLTVATAGFTLIALPVGFSIAAGATIKTLTVDLNLTASTAISVAGTVNRISTSGTTTLSAGGTISTIDIAATYVGQASITTLGTITTGVWNGTVITVPFGGTGLATLTLHAIQLGNGTGTPTQLAVGTSGTVLTGVTGSDPAFSATPTVTSLTSSLGTGAGTMVTSGRADTQTSSTGIGNGADATDDTLFTYSLPLNSMSANGKSLRASAWGHFATNGNNKRVKFFFAGTAVADSAVVTHNNVDWECQIEVTRIDSTHVSARGIFTASGIAPVVTVTPNLVVADLTANASIVKITGASPTTAAANDVLGYAMNNQFSN